MDLHNYKPALSTFDLDIFECLESYNETEEKAEARFIRKTDEDQAPICVPLRGWSLADTDSTLSTDDEEHEKGERYQHSLHDTPISLTIRAYYRPEQPVAGNYVILCPKASKTICGLPASLTELPFTSRDWGCIANWFYIPASITRTILRQVTYVSSAHHHIPDMNEDKHRLQISYTARMAGSIQEDLAMSCTYLPDTRTTYSVFYGCSEEQSRAIEKRIRSAGDDANHPLLMVGIFVELEYKRLVNAVEALMDMFVTEVDILEHGRSHNPDATTQRLLTICLKAQTLADQIRSIKRQLAKVSAEFDELVWFWQSEEYTRIISSPSKDSSGTNSYERDWRVDNVAKERMMAIARQMGERIRDIQDEYDDKLDECNTMAQTGYNHTARLDSLTNARIARANTDIAIETKRESSQMRYIALLTMIFLPLSCVASVFSTTIFNWEPEDGHPVVSSYIWVLLGIALLLTIVTVLAWWFFTWRERKREEQKRNEDLEKGMRQS